MSPRAVRSLALGLAVCVVLVTAVMSVRMVSHAAHHAHHKAGTHATVVCTWMCAAGQVLEGHAIQLPVGLGPQTPIFVPGASRTDGAVPPHPSSRAPPFSSLSI